MSGSTSVGRQDDIAVMEPDRWLCTKSHPSETCRGDKNII